MFNSSSVLGLDPVKFHTAHVPRRSFASCLLLSKSANVLFRIPRSTNASDLYGFEKKEEKDFFEILLGISGIGPKSAINILNVATVSDLKKAVSTSDTSHLIKVSGIGKKMAEKIVLELKGKFNDDETISLKSEVEAIEALKALGYSQKESRDALKSIPNTLHTPEDRIKAALKLLGK